MTVIEVTNLHKRYRDHVAVEDVSLTVERGEIFGIVGPNGAGKTTTVEAIGGLRRPDGGSIRVLELAPNDPRLRQRLGFQRVWTPGPTMPDSVRRVADFTPLGAASQAMQDAWAGSSPRLLHLLVMVVCTVLFGAVAAKTFRWE